MQKSSRKFVLSVRVLEVVARTLTVASFVAICWVASRVMQVRTQCVNSSFLSFIQLGLDRVDNCSFESRLSLSTAADPLRPEQVAAVRALETLEPLRALLPTRGPSIAVDVSREYTHAFELGQGYLRIGQGWLEDSQQTLRALVMSLVKQRYGSREVTPFHLEVMSDFLMLTVLEQDSWHSKSMRELIRFPTMAVTFKQYCKSPFRSLALRDSCGMARVYEGDSQSDIWGYEPMIVMALVRVYDKLSLTDKLKVLEHIRNMPDLPQLPNLDNGHIGTRVNWLNLAVRSYLRAFGVEDSDRTEFAIKRSFKELDIGIPTHWELTVDITNTPAWPEVIEQFKTWSKLHPTQRILVFTPNGAIALPANLPVAWAESEVQSQKHVMIACQWPKPDTALKITARHLYAQQSCGKIEKVFWN